MRTKAAWLGSQQYSIILELGLVTAKIDVCVVATELALVQCFAIRFLTNPKTIMQS